jgi:hypothetical protein
MNGWLRGRSLGALLLFGGWSLFVNARERLAPRRSPTVMRSVPERPPTTAKRADVVWN